MLRLLEARLCQPLRGRADPVLVPATVVECDVCVHVGGRQTGHGVLEWHACTTEQPSVLYSLRKVSFRRHDTARDTRAGGQYDALTPGDIDLAASLPDGT
jgi:hypothetical protein